MTETHSSALFKGRIPKNRRYSAAKLGGFAAALALAVLAAAGLGLLWLYLAERSSLPQMDGTLHVAGLSAAVTVRRDAHGVPHIDAATQDDLFFAQGYVTAQDRLWQMDMFRRHANGNLAQILGPGLVEHDRMQRVLGFGRQAQRIYASLPADDRQRLDDYARGVNAFIAQSEAAGRLPAEFRVLLYKPQPWTGTDCVSVGLMEVQELDMHAATKLDRWYVAAKLNDPKLESDLYPVGSWRDHPPTGVDLDLTQPQPLPTLRKENDEDDDSTQALNGASRVSDARPFESLRGVPDSRKTAAGPSAAPQDDSAGATAGPSAAPQDDSAGTTAGPSAAPQDDSAGATAGPSAAPQDDSAGATAGPSAAPQDDSASWRAAERALGRPACEGCAVGSNEWVIAGSHTASGKPLLSNDMHIKLTEPNIWYMAGLRAPGFDAAGVTLPGLPFIIAGHNQHVAWGFTALMADVQDLYFETLDGKGNYLGADRQWHPLGTDREIIHVRGGRDVTVNVESTDHGPLVNSLVHEPSPIALQWNIYDPALHTIPIYAMNVAENWAEFSAALADWCWPAQNLVYADDQGHIAYHATGKVPLRPAGLTGVPIDDHAHEWQGYIPFSAMPNAFDPPAGFLATANARVTTPQSPYPLTLEWIDPYRDERIYKLLDGRDGLTPRDMLAAQTDIYSELDQEMGQRFAYAIDHTDGVDERLRKAADLMRSWDGRLSLDSAAASVVDRARAALWPLILKPKLGDRWKDYHWGESQYALEQIVMDARPGWLPPGYRDWNALLTEAVRKGLEQGNAPANVDNWKYGDWHLIDIEHPLAPYLPLIGRLAGTGPQPASGDTTTVKQMSPFVGPSQRFTMDWSNVDGSTENIVLGESSDPLSPYYRDQWNAWYNGATFALPFTPAAVAAQTSHTLTLRP